MRRTEDTLFVEFQRTKDPRVLGEIYDLVAPELLHVALHLTGRPTEAEDLLQTTFLAAIERAESFLPGRRLRPWLLGILTRQARNLHADRRREPDPERLQREEAPTPEQEAVRLELNETVDLALLELPPAYQPVLALRLRHGLKAAEIAAALRRPPGTVRAQITRGLELLRRSLPAGLAGAVAGVLGRPARGMSGVREVVVAAARPAAPHTLSWITGVLLMKKTLAALGVLATLALAWSIWRPDADRPRPTTSPATVLAAPELTPTDTVLETSADTESTRTEALSGADETALPVSEATRGALTIRAHFEVDDRPAPDVLVIVERYLGELPYPERLIARTDAEGTAHLEELAPGPLVARLLRGTQSDVLVRTGSTTTVSLSVFEGMTVVGDVVDETGRGIAGAEILLTERWRRDVTYLVARADAAGRFRIRSVTEDHAIGARAPDRAASFLQTVRGQDGEEVEVRFVLGEAGARVSGRVLDERGLPVPDAIVSIGEETFRERGRLEDGSVHGGPPPARAKVNAEGRFELDSLPLGSQPFQARAPGFAPFHGWVEVVPTGTTETRIELLPEARVTGLVTNALGQPVAAAHVYTPDTERFAASSVFSGFDGTFELTGLAAGRTHLLAEHEHGSDELVLELRTDTDHEWNPILAAEPRFHGVILGADDQPLERWRVVAITGPGEELRRRSEPTEADGRFTVEAVADEPHTLWVQGPDGWRSFPVEILEDVLPPLDPMVIRIDDDSLRAASITGAILDRRGNAVADATLTVWHDEKRIWREFTTEPETGRLAVENVPPGTLHLEVRSKTHPWLSIGERVVAAGEEVDLGDIVLLDAGRITGSVAGLPEEALESLHLMVSGEDNQEAGVLVRTNDGYRSGPLAEGTYVVFAGADRAQDLRHEVEVRVGKETRQDLVFQPAGMRRVVFEKPEAAQPPRYMWCSVSDATGRQVWLRGAIRPNEAGILETNVSVLPGSYRIFGETNNGLRAEGKLEVPGYEHALEPLRVRLFRARKE